MIHTGEIAALGTALMWTLSVQAWTSAGRRIGSLPAGFLRLLLAWVFLACYGLAVRGRPLPTDADARTWMVLGASGFVGFFLADMFIFRALVLVGPRLATLCLSLTPPMAAVVSWAFLGEALALRDWLAMGVTIAGVTWVVLERPDAAGAPPRRHYVTGIVLGVLGAAAAAGGVVLAREGIGDYDAVAATFIRAIAGAAGYAVLFTVARRWKTIPPALRHRRAMGIVVYGTFVGTFLGVIFYMVAVRHCLAGVVATIISTVPVLILPFAIVIYREKVSIRAAAGAVLAVAGVAWLVLGS